MQWRINTIWVTVVASFWGLAADRLTAAQIDFDRDVRPILRKCIGCHGPDRPKADVSLAERATAIESGVIVPGDDACVLLERISSTDPDVRMPPDTPLSQSEQQVLRSWIDQGASWPDHWAYRELVQPLVPSPTTAAREWCRNAIDCFVADQLAMRQLAPSPPADPAALLRRVYYDLIGLPPTYAEIEEFRRDPSERRYLRIVDELLASPHYGERWARHWMDVVHFAETHGHDQDRPREHAWPYRDYLVRRFNDDVPFAQFVREQIAGDCLSPLDPLAITATGMLAAGPWDESSLRDIQEDSIDRQVAQYIDRDDIITTVMSTFASTTIHCARCHHHKFDAISQDEYYGLQAIFAGIDKANRLYDVDGLVAERRNRLQQRMSLLADWVAREDAELLATELQRQTAVWEQTRRARESQWRDVRWIAFSAGSGAELVREADNSLFANHDTAAIPDKDTYRLEFETDSNRVRGLRLMLLPDARLPMQGPGRAGNGNLHLNEIRVYQADTRTGRWQRRRAIVRVTSDYDQPGWDVTRAIDGNPNTAWGIYPQVGLVHQAVFELDDEDADDKLNDDETKPIRCRVELDQIHGGGHLIGRFAIGVTDAVGPYEVEAALPADIHATLHSNEPRTEDQQRRLNAYVERDRIEQALASLPEQRMVYCGTNQFAADGSFRPVSVPREVQVLQRGELAKPLRVARPVIVGSLTSAAVDLNQLRSENEGERRVAFAEWLASERNGIVWRSITNRIWHYHFGAPLVATMNDFGRGGESPTHPQLLDWLAAELRLRRGSLKELHRLIVTSATYRQAVAHRAAPAKVDAENRQLWRMNRRRLDAESFRDSLLKISGQLDERMGGPSDQQFNQSPGVHVTPVVDYDGFDLSNRANYRRSVYRFVFRTVPDPFMEALDCPDASQLSPQRGESITAVQTLATMNDKLVVHLCEQIAFRIEAGDAQRGTASTQSHVEA
ncbi:MAG: PSD1 domain-containing protein, partial [Planctomycetales bacterium]|nr:PSD1 domain-containing protein [Planctomycetales bacterium]